MPDFTMETYYQCVTSIEFSAKIEGSKGDLHTVTLSPSNRGDCNTNWHCTCKGFKFRKTCSHIKEAQRELHCGWMQITDGKTPTKKDGEAYCPCCGEKAVARQWAT